MAEHLANAPLVGCVAVARRIFRDAAQKRERLFSLLHKNLTDVAGRDLVDVGEVVRRRFCAIWNGRHDGHYRKSACSSPIGENRSRGLPVAADISSSRDRAKVPALARHASRFAIAGLVSRSWACRYARNVRAKRRWTCRVYSMPICMTSAAGPLSMDAAVSAASMPVSRALPMPSPLREYVNP